MNNKFLLQDLVQSILDTNDLDKKEVDAFVRSYFAVLEQAIFEKEYVKIKNLGKFSLQKMRARKSVDISTGEASLIKSHYRLSFVPDNKLKELVNHPFAHLESVELDSPEEKIDASLSSPIESLTSNKSNTKEENSMKKKEKSAFVVSDQPTAKEKASPALAPKSPKGKLAAWIVFVVIMCALIIYALMKTVFSISSVEFETETRVQEIVSEPESTVPVLEEPITPVVQEIDPANWEVFKVVRLERGKRLTLLAQEYYGNKVFWVYIYEANKDHIANPNKILAGTKIKIPKADPSVIDAQNPESIRIAKEKETKLRARFSK